MAEEEPVLLPKVKDRPQRIGPNFCKDCEYFRSRATRSQLFENPDAVDKDELTIGWGECHIRSPSVAGRYDERWALVNELEDCGEFKEPEV